MKKVLMLVLAAVAVFAGARELTELKEAKKSNWVVVGDINGSLAWGASTAYGHNKILTCAHFFAKEKNDPEALIFKSYLEEKQEAKVLHRDYDLDFAILETNSTLENTAKLADIDDVKVGDFGYIFASPFGDKNAVNTSVHITDINKTHITFSVDATLGFGHSGSAVFSKDGELMGIVTHKSKDSKTGFAVHTDPIMKALGKIADERAPKKTFAELYRDRKN